ncbi:MAG: hypothetical protein ACOY9D_03505 [Pseudomonadota bacterium]
MSKRRAPDRILLSQGFDTRKWCSEWIASGEVVGIDGVTVTGSRAAI